MDRQSIPARSELNCMLCDEKAEPKALLLSLLQEITNGFSEEQEIGRGGFAVVYKGMLDNGAVIAVKRLSNTYMYEKQFHREIECLIKVKHKNVVRFIGYCVDSQGKAETYNGRFVMADVQQRLLCFEYLPHTLDKYITDASCGLEWRTRYKIINGICNGLHYLHKNRVVHLDLKPPNILMDGNLLPKIADFGLSRCFDENQSRAITTKIGGTTGYLAPEFGSREITYRLDIYSLGVIILEILTGMKGYEDVENVLESWSRRLEISHWDIQLEQVRVCTEIALRCIESNPAKRPASMQHIISRLHETGNADVSVETVQLEWDYTREVARQKLEQELGGREAAEDLSKEKYTTSTTKPDTTAAHPSVEAHADDGEHQQRSRLARINSKVQLVSDEVDEQTKKRNLYIVLISIHGLVRGENMELDRDTGGQVNYVVELARALAATAGVHRVDLLTRHTSCPDGEWTYSKPIEMLERLSLGGVDDNDGEGEQSGGGAYIVRLPCGPRDKYIPKEELWPHIPEFMDRALSHVTEVACALGEQLQPPPAGDAAVVVPIWPYVIHGHYADASEVAANLASTLNVPMVMTGHSLGRNKLEQLLKLGPMLGPEIEGMYKIARQIEAEETGLDMAELVVTSTKQEIEEQWGLYDGFDLMVERKLRVRQRRGISSLGRYMPRMAVIPPGMDFSFVETQDTVDGDGADLQMLIALGKFKKALPPIWSEVLRFFTDPHKPMILALSLPDPKKNVTTLLKAYGENRHLRELANLTLILGNREDIEDMAGGGGTVLRAAVNLIDRYDLYGHVAYPKRHKQTDVPHIYRLAAKTKGVFINPALVEPFGLTIIEAAAYGLPVVATKNGGPVEILKALDNGLLVDPLSAVAIADALFSLLADKSRWIECRRNGLRNIHRFSWPHHCRLYLSHVATYCDAPSLQISVDAPSDLNAADSAAAIMDALRRRPASEKPVSSARALGFAPGRRQSLLVVAVDSYTDEGKLDVEQLKKAVDAAVSAGDGAGGKQGYVLSTGMTIPEAAEAIKACGADVADFDALICSSGAELCYPWKELAADEEYAGHVAFRWPGDHVKSAVPRLGSAEEIALAIDPPACSVHCHAYAAADASKVKKVDSIRQALRMRGFRCNLVYTRACTRLNVIPLSASRPRALRYLSIQWGIDLSKVAVLVGETGDTDRERLLPGVHRTLILPGMVARGSEELLRGDDGYTTADVVAMDSPNIVTLAEGQSASDLLKTT